MVQTDADELLLLVGFSAGSASNFVARAIAPALGDALGRPVRIERVPGENGALCAQRLARAAPDGRTLAIAIQANVIGSLLQSTRRYDPLNDFAAVALFARSPLVLAASNALGIADVNELIALARARPGQLTYGASALGGAPHLAGVLFGLMARVELALRVYAETNVLYDDLVHGRIAVTFNNLMSALPLARAGRLRLLALTGRERSAHAPDVPTLNEAALPGYELMSAIGIVAPAGTPSTAIERLNRAFAEVVNAPAVREALTAGGLEPVAAPAGEFARHMRTELERWSRFIRAHPAAFAGPPDPGRSAAASGMPPDGE